MNRNLTLSLDEFTARYIAPACKVVCEKVVNGEPLEEIEVLMLDENVHDWRSLYGIAKSNPSS